MEDIIRSRNDASIKNGWFFGEKLQRIGDPFTWVDTEQIGSYKKIEILKGVSALLQYLSLFYEEYPLPKEIKCDDFDEMRLYIEKCLRDAYDHFVPFISAKEFGFEQYIISTSYVRGQDYSAIKSLIKGIKGPLNHLDIGSGLGTHAIYSLKAFKSTFYALEAYPLSYAIQRDFFRFLSHGGSTYLDLVECENLYQSEEKMKEFVREAKFKIKHIPSWHFGMVPDGTMDLITATWVLNEVTTAGILWLISHSIRALKKGGYLYIRDSGKLKPMRHTTNYDELLLELGFEKTAAINVRNRIDFYGVPRVYRKTNDVPCSFEHLVDKYINRLSIPAWGGDLGKI